MIDIAKPPRKLPKWVKYIQHFFWKIFGYCPQHGWFLYPKRFRQNTAYIDDEMNWAYGCKYCQQESHEYWQEMWNEYYSSIL